MTNKLTLNDELKPLFDTDDKQLWDLILENKTDELLSLLPREDGDTLDDILQELFSEGKSDTLDQYDFVTIKEGNATLFRDLIRLIFALDINGNHEAVRHLVADKLSDTLPDIVENIQQVTKGYPMQKVSDVVIAETATIRASLNTLSYYYRLKEDLEALHFAIVLRTKITLAIMRNYKNVLGHDMVEAAKVKEQMGDTEAALGFYNVVRDNLKNELHWFVESPEMGPSEEDVVMLQSLKEAYASIDRLGGTSQFAETCLLIDEILGREYVEYDFDAEDDEDED